MTIKSQSSSVNIKQLANGLRIATDEMKEVESVSIGLFVHTGSRNESKSINGMSHFLEHMAFKGTTTRSAKQIAEEFEGIGGRINAYTSKEKTVYYAKVLKQHLEFAVKFLADIIQNSIFDKEELERERGVILQEIAMTNDTPDDIVFDYFQDTAYPKQSLGRSILGSVKNIKKFQREDFLNYINSQYSTKNIAIAASGNFNSLDLEKWVEKYFSNLGQSKIKKIEEAKYQGGNFLKERKLEQIHMVMGFKGFSYLDKDHYKSQILAMILGSGMSSRLFQECRENRGLAYSIYAFNYNYADAGVFAIYAGTTPDKANELFTTTKSEIKKICEKVNDNELARVRMQFEASLLMAKESTSSRMQKIGSDLLCEGRVISDEEILENVFAVGKDDLTKIAEEIFSSTPTFSAIGKVKGLAEFKL